MNTLPESQITKENGRLQVSVEYIEWLELVRAKINGVDLSNIDFYNDGQKLEMDDRSIKRFKFIGLSNECFVLSGFYRDYDNDPIWEGIDREL